MQHMMSFDPELCGPVSDPCYYCKVQDGKLFLLVLLDDYVCAYSNWQDFDGLLWHFRAAPSNVAFLDVKLLEEVTNLLHMRTLGTNPATCLDVERHNAQLAAHHGVADCKPLLTHMVVHTWLCTLIYNVHLIRCKRSYPSCSWQDACFG